MEEKIMVCPNCKKNKSYAVAGGKQHCRNCGTEFIPQQTNAPQQPTDPNDGQNPSPQPSGR
jgi:ribosomal protein L37AE/L43A